MPVGIYLIATMLDPFFIQPENLPSNLIHGEYSPYLVLLSYLVATLASYTGLTLSNKIYLARTNDLKNLLHVGGAFALGSGIWAMHFIGMLAYHVKVPMHFDLEYTILSIVIAIAGAAFALTVSRARELKWRHVAISAILLGLAICLMHYTGMAAIRMEANVVYAPFWFLVSIFVGIAVSAVALGIIFYFGRSKRKHIYLLRILAAMILGLGVCGMHFTGMYAASFIPFDAACRASDFITQPLAMNRDMLALAVTLMTGVVVILALTVGIYNQEQKSLVNLDKNDVFPLRLITVSVFLTFFSILTIGGFSARIAQQMNLQKIRSERVHSLSLAYVALDKKLSNALTLFALTKQRQWGDAYLSLAYEQQRILRQLKENLKNEDETQFDKFDAAEGKRSQIERSILNLSGGGEENAALKVMRGVEYQDIKENYETQLDLMVQDAVTPSNRKISQFVEDDYVIVFFSLLSAILLGIFWYFAFRSVRRWQRQLIDNRNDLNARYQEKEALEKRLNTYIEEVKRARDRALRAMHEADHANKAKTDFLTNMSHELRTPMNSILGLTELLLKNEKTIPEHKELLAVILEAGETLLKIVNDVLDIAKIEAEEVSLQKKPFILQAMLFNVLNTLKPMAMEKDLDLTYDFDEDDIVLNEDELRLTRIFTNLLANAVKYTDFGSVCFSVHVVENDIGMQILRGEITDTGIGIPPDKLESIFEKFSQADNSITRKYGGTGLGLAITKELVELMSGDISVESNSGKGSKFLVEIPVETSAYPITSGIKARPLQIKAFEPVGRMLLSEAKILVAEDHPLNQIFMQTLFAELGFRHVLLAGDGLEVLSILKKEKIDIVLMDCQMPELDGYSTTMRIRENESATGRHLPIIAMTARAMVGDRQRCLDVGMDDYISKPVDIQTLQKILSRWIIME